MTKERPTILLMDENAAILEQLQTVLQRDGYHVLVSADGEAGLRLAIRNRPDLIISDLLLAGLDGYEVWQNLRADKEMPKIPVLVISALTVPPPETPWRPNANAEWRLLSYDAFLPKPVDLRQLRRVVKKLLQADLPETILAGPSAAIAMTDRATQQLLAAILTEHDFEVETPASLADTHRLLNTTPPAVLILDYRSMDVAVKELTTHVKNTTSYTVVILVIDPAVKPDPDCLAQCDGFLVQPLSGSYVATVVKQVLSRYSLARRNELLSHQLISTNRDLLDAQHVLRAQNEELQHINVRLKDLDRLKETLTNMVVHDLKTPLAAILGAISFLTTDPDLQLSQISQSLLTGAMAAGNQMVRLTETLLERQRLEDGHMQPDREPFHFPTVVDVSLQQVSPLVTLHRLTVQAIIADDLPLALADPHISQRILENLLDNAIKFSPRNSQIVVRVAPDNGFIKVTIEDKGPGIPKAEQEAIFDQFTQLKNVEKSSYRVGFGLGLAFCKLATQAMGGSIWVESDGESGTKFLFTVPTYNEDET